MMIANVFAKENAQANQFDFSLPAHTAEISEKLNADLKLKLEFTHVMLKAGEDLDIKIEKEIGIDKNPFDHPEKLSKLLNEEVGVYRSFFEKSLNIPKEKIGFFREVFNRIDWSKIIPMLKKAHLGIEVFFKKKGFGIGLAVMAGIMCEYLVPVTLIHLGLANLIPFSVMTPWSVMYSFIPGVIQKRKINSMLVESLGSQEKVMAYNKQQEEMSKLLHLSSPDDFLLPIRDLGDEVQSITIHQEAWWKRILPDFGFESKYLNDKTLRQFLEDNNVDEPYINWIQKNSSLDKNTKIVLIVNHLFSKGDSSIEQKFLEQFSDQLINLKTNPRWEETWNWVQNMKKIRKMSEVLKGIDQLPEETTPKEIAVLWEDILLPEYIQHLDLNYGEARNMVDQFEVLKAKLYLLPNEGIKEQTRGEIFSFLKKIIAGKNFKGCKNGPDKIVKYLLKEAVTH